MTNREWLKSLSPKKQKLFFTDGFYACKYTCGVTATGAVLLNIQFVAKGAFKTIDDFVGWFDEEQDFVLPTKTARELISEFFFTKIRFVEFENKDNGSTGILLSGSFLQEYGDYITLDWSQSYSCDGLRITIGKECVDD